MTSSNRTPNTIAGATNATTIVAGEEKAPWR